MRIISIALFVLSCSYNAHAGQNRLKRFEVTKEEGYYPVSLWGYEPKPVDIELVCSRNPDLCIQKKKEDENYKKN